MARRFTRDDQLVAVFVAVTLANAAISYTYTKDVILSPAGIFYAAALDGGREGASSRLARSRPAASRIAVLTMFLVVLVGRVGVVAPSAYISRCGRRGHVVRNEWVVHRRLDRTARSRARRGAASR